MQTEIKEKIRAVREFTCFYIALPLFVLLILVSGVNVAGSNEEKAEEKVFTSLSEDINIGNEVIALEIPTDNGYAIVARNLNKDYAILNSTSEEVDEEALLKKALPYSYKEGVPLVLVVHTHATESFASESQSFPTADGNGNFGFYDENSETRTKNTEENIVAVGEVFSAVLSEKGIGVIQCRTLNDDGDYNNAYKNSRREIEDYLKKYPTIKYVVDIHRDSLIGNDNSKTKTLADFEEKTAQVMFVCGTSFDGWRENLSVALKIKKAMDEEYPSLSRPIYLRNSKYNLDLTKGSLLLEVGTCGNTLKEAKRAARLAAECFASVIKQEN